MRRCSLLVHGELSGLVKSQGQAAQKMAANDLALGHFIFVVIVVVVIAATTI